MRYLGIDFGRKRIGLAASDPETKIAFPKKVIINLHGRSKVFEELGLFCRTEKISHIVIGLPLNLDGSESRESKEVRRFAEDLKKEIDLPVEFENEMLTTHIVETSGVSRRHSDAAAAAVILQSYIEKQDKS